MCAAIDSQRDEARRADELAKVREKHETMKRQMGVA